MKSNQSIMLLQMEPFGIGHLEALESIKSPFLCGDTLPNYADLIKATIICVHPANQIGGFDGWFFRLKVRLWLRRVRRLNWNAEVVRMRRHVLAGLHQLRDDILAELEAKGAA